MKWWFFMSFREFSYTHVSKSEWIFKERSELVLKCRHKISFYFKRWVVMIQGNIYIPWCAQINRNKRFHIPTGYSCKENIYLPNNCQRIVEEFFIYPDYMYTVIWLKMHLASVHHFDKKSGKHFYMTEKNKKKSATTINLYWSLDLYNFFKLLFGCPAINLGSLLRRQPHSLNANYCVFTILTWGSPGAL